MENNIETSRALATRIYDLDSEVYRLVGSSPWTHFLPATNENKYS